MLRSIGSVNGYDKTSMEVVCAPLTVGAIEQTFAVEYKEVQDTYKSVDDEGNLVTRVQYFDVKTKGEEVPIFLMEETLDMKTSLFGRTYRKRLEVRNRSRQSYRINILIPPPYDKFIEASPQMCFVQVGGDSQFINLRFTPSTEMLTQLSYFSVLEEGFPSSALMNIPIQIDVINQELPL